MSKEKILIVDDEEYIRKLIKRSLINENYIFKEASSARETITHLENSIFDLIILDVMLGDQDGFELIREIRFMGINTPVIFVSGRNEDYDKILGLGLGAVNYITKPFNPAILCAHVKAQIRSHRQYAKTHNTLSQFIIEGPFKFDLKSYKLYKGGEFIDLSYKETLLFKFFIENPQQVFTKEQLYENVWDDIIINDNAVMVYIHQLRKKIEINTESPRHIITIWGIGYKFMP